MVSVFPVCRSILRTFGLFVFSCSLLVLLSPDANAHRMKVFAWVEGDTVGGEAYFMGGEVIANATIELLAEKNVVATTQSDTTGQFSFGAVTPGSYQIRADAGQGHVANFNIGLAEFVTETSVDPAVTASLASDPGSTTAVVTSAQLEKAIAKAIRPLREELDKYEAKVRLHDVLGGIGYIFGLFGLWVLLRKRRQ